MTICAFLVDVYCLGVKDTLGPETANAGSLHTRLRYLYQAFDRTPLEIGLDQARAEVLGAVAYAHALGFAPAPGFADLAPYLGEVSGDEPRIGFGRQSKPYYIAGPRDDARHVIHTLEKSCGKDGFHYMVAAGQL